MQSYIKPTQSNLNNKPKPNGNNGTSVTNQQVIDYVNSHSNPIDSFINNMFNNPVGKVGDATRQTATNVVLPVSNTINNINNFTNKLSSSELWLNVGGVVIGSVLIFLSANVLMKQELINTSKKLVGV